MNNPMNLLKMLKSGGNPQQIAMNILSNNSQGNPIIENALNMANQGNMSGVEQLVRNICKNRGIDADEMLKNVQNQFRM